MFILPPLCRGTRGGIIHRDRTDLKRYRTVERPLVGSHLSVSPALADRWRSSCDCYVGLCWAAVSIASRALSQIGGPSIWASLRAGSIEHPRRRKIARSAKKVSGFARHFRDR